MWSPKTPTTTCERDSSPTQVCPHPPAALLIINIKHIQIPNTHILITRFTDEFIFPSSRSCSGNDNRYASLAEQLRQRIVELKIKIDRQLRVLEAVKAQIKAQFVAIQRLEVNTITLLRVTSEHIIKSYFSVHVSQGSGVDKKCECV